MLRRRRSSPTSPSICARTSGASPVALALRVAAKGVRELRELTKERDAIRQELAAANAQIAELRKAAEAKKE